jgi:formylglycine-generating enzyme required for sulfatase activity
MQAWVGRIGAMALVALVLATAPANIAAQSVTGDGCRDSLPISVGSGAKACIKPGSGESFKDCPECPEMVVVPAGSFLMGSPENEEGSDVDEGPQHAVTIGTPFAVGRFAVTFAEWDACLADGGCRGYKLSGDTDAGWGRGDRPVVNASWYDGQAYAQWLSGRTGKTYRLLSEAEREYVTRAGTTTPFWLGTFITPERANYNGNLEPYRSFGKWLGSRQQTLPVKSFNPNPWGLYQVHGNVEEWTEDCWHKNYEGAPADGSAWTTADCEVRVLRGGSWVAGPYALRSAYRAKSLLSYGVSSRGFRIARTLKP